MMRARSSGEPVFGAWLAASLRGRPGRRGGWAGALAAFFVGLDNSAGAPLAALADAAFVTLFDALFGLLVDAVFDDAFDAVFATLAASTAWIGLRVSALAAAGALVFREAEGGTGAPGWDGLHFTGLTPVQLLLNAVQFISGRPAMVPGTASAN